MLTTMYTLFSCDSNLIGQWLQNSGIGLAWPEKMLVPQSHGNVNTKVEHTVIHE